MLLIDICKLIGCFVLHLYDELYSYPQAQHRLWNDTAHVNCIRSDTHVPRHKHAHALMIRHFFSCEGRFASTLMIVGDSFSPTTFDLL